MKEYIVKYCIFLGFAGALFLAASNVRADSGNLGTDQSGPSHQDASPSRASSPGWIVPYAGIDIAPGSNFGYGGVVFAPNGNLTEPGIVINGFGGYGKFKYDSAVVPGKRVHGSVSMADALIGYQTFGKFYRISGYIGIENQNIHLSRLDASAKIGGDETGIKFLVNFETDNRVRPYLNAMASYSTAFDSYLVSLRPGYRVAPFIFGPEISFQGNRGGNSQRIGGFVSIERPINKGNYFYLTVSGGYAFVGDNSWNGVGGTHNGPYGSLLVSFFF